MFLYLAGESVGYVGRILAVADIPGYSLEKTNYYIIQFTLLTIVPNFFNAAVYSQYGRFLYAFGTTEAKIRTFNVFGRKFQPTLMSFVLIFIDFLCIFIQAVGGNVLRSATTKQQINIGTGIYIAGIALQCFSMSCFTLLFSKLMYNIYVKQRLDFFKNKDAFHLYDEKLHSLSPSMAYFQPWKWSKIIKSVSLEEISRLNADGPVTSISLDNLNNFQKRMFNVYPIFLSTAFILAIIRCFYRLFEVAIGGWGGYLMNHEWFLIALDFIPLSIGAVITCLFSEGFVFGREGIKTLKRVKLNHYDGRSSIKRLGLDIKVLFSRTSKIQYDYEQYSGKDDQTL